MVCKALLRLFEPRGTCLLCGAFDPAYANLCTGCALDLPVFGPTCEHCAMPVPTAAVTRCAHCLQAPPRHAACIAALPYVYPVQDLVARFKFHGDLAAGRLLAERLAARAATLPVSQRDGRVLVPVPLHPVRLRERGFNQAERIAQALAARLVLPVAHGLVARVLCTPDQKRLAAAARQRNLQGAFRAGPCTGLRIVLVDDVLTTGATVAAITDTLLDAGATEVQVWCAARAL